MVRQEGEMVVEGIVGNVEKTDDVPGCGGCGGNVVSHGDLDVIQNDPEVDRVSDRGCHVRAVSAEDVGKGIPDRKMVSILLHAHSPH